MINKKILFIFLSCFAVSISYIDLHGAANSQKSKSKEQQLLNIARDIAGEKTTFKDARKSILDLFKNPKPINFDKKSKDGKTLLQLIVDQCKEKATNDILTLLGYCLAYGLDPDKLASFTLPTKNQNIQEKYYELIMLTHSLKNVIAEYKSNKAFPKLALATYLKYFIRANLPSKTLHVHHTKKDTYVEVSTTWLHDLMQAPLNFSDFKALFELFNPTPEELCYEDKQKDTTYNQHARKTNKTVLEYLTKTTVDKQLKIDYVINLIAPFIYKNQTLNSTISRSPQLFSVYRAYLKNHFKEIAPDIQTYELLKNTVYQNPELFMYYLEHLKDTKIESSELLTILEDKIFINKLREKYSITKEYSSPQEYYFSFVATDLLPKLDPNDAKTFRNKVKQNQDFFIEITTSHNYSTIGQLLQWYQSPKDLPSYDQSINLKLYGLFTKQDNPSIFFYAYEKQDGKLICLLTQEFSHLYNPLLKDNDGNTLFHKTIINQEPIDFFLRPQCFNTQIFTLKNNSEKTIFDLILEKFKTEMPPQPKKSMFNKASEANPAKEYAKDAITKILLQYSEMLTVEQIEKYIIPIVGKENFAQQITGKNIKLSSKVQVFYLSQMSTQLLFKHSLLEQEFTSEQIFEILKAQFIASIEDKRFADTLQILTHHRLTEEQKLALTNLKIDDKEVMSILLYQPPWGHDPQEKENLCIECLKINPQLINNTYADQYDKKKQLICHTSNFAIMSHILNSDVLENKKEALEHVAQKAYLFFEYNSQLKEQAKQVLTTIARKFEYLEDFYNHLPQYCSLKNKKITILNFLKEKSVKKELINSWIEQL